MYTLHATQKLRDRLAHGAIATEARTTTALGDWHATILFWQPQVALFVNDLTLLPVLVAFAPAATLLDRFPAASADLLRAHELPRAFVEPEVAAMATRQVAKTASRSVLGSMNEFAYSRAPIAPTIRMPVSWSDRCNSPRRRAGRCSSDTSRRPTSSAPSSQSSIRPSR